MSGALAVTTIESVADGVAQEVSHTFAGALVEGLIGWGWLGRRGPSAWNPWCWIPRSFVTGFRECLRRREAGRLAGQWASG